MTYLPIAVLTASISYDSGVGNINLSFCLLSWLASINFISFNENPDAVWKKLLSQRHNNPNVFIWKDSSSLWIIEKNVIIQYGYYMYVLWKGFFVLYHTQLDSKAEWTKEKEFLQILDSFSSPTFTSLPRFAGTRIISFVISNHSLSFISRQ